MPIAPNTAALEPLFAPWEEPNAHRIRAESKIRQADSAVNVGF